MSDGRVGSSLHNFTLNTRSYCLPDTLHEPLDWLSVSSIIISNISGFGHSHPAQTIAEPEPLSETQTDQVTDPLSVETLVELLTLVHLDMVVEPGH